MVKITRKRTIVLLTVAGLALGTVPIAAAAGNAQDVPKTESESETEAKAGAGAEPAVEWGTCPPIQGPGAESPQAARLQCGTVRVPVDYSRPNGRTIDVAVSRLPSADPAKRRGVLLMNPGGPGGSGLATPLMLAQMGAPSSLLATYDLIGFDPRGVGRSAPLTCGLKPGEIQRAMYPAYAKNPADVAEQAKFSDALAARCVAKGGKNLPHITTRNTARDMDRIRESLGEKKISYFGLSYGTYLGAVYGELFKNRMDRFVLDSAIGPKLAYRDQFRSWGLATELRFPDFGTWAATRHGTYGLGSTEHKVRTTFFELADRLDKKPVGGMDGSAFRAETHSLLASDTYFPQIAQLWQGLDQADSRAVRKALAAKESRLGAAPSPSTEKTSTGKTGADNTGADKISADNTLAANTAIQCGDVAWPKSLRTYQRDVETDVLNYPMMGGMAANVHTCARWPLAPREARTEITSDGPANVLIVQNLRDPSTLHTGAVELRQELGDRSRLVGVHQGGHGVYLLTQNACANNITTRYLVEGEFPAKDRICPASRK